jgi:hypothetical protein
VRVLRIQIKIKKLKEPKKLQYFTARLAQQALVSVAEDIVAFDLS